MNEIGLCNALRASTAQQSVQNDRLSVLKRFFSEHLPDFHHALSPTSLFEICSEIEWVTPANNSILFLQQDEGNCFYVVVHGGVNLYFEEDKGREAVMRKRFGPSVGTTFRGTEKSLGTFVAHKKVCTE